MDTEQFRAWERRLGLTADQTAELLGISRRMVFYYRGGRPIPRLVELAIAGVSNT